MKGTLRICKQGHRYYKSRDCPTCPICEEERKPVDGFLSLLSAPARRALEREQIKMLEQLSKRSKAAIMQLHGMGPTSITKLNEALQLKGLAFRKR